MLVSLTFVMVAEPVVSAVGFATMVTALPAALAGATATMAEDARSPTVAMTANAPLVNLFTVSPLRAGGGCAFKVHPYNKVGYPTLALERGRIIPF